MDVSSLREHKFYHDFMDWHVKSITAPSRYEPKLLYSVLLIIDGSLANDTSFFFQNSFIKYIVSTKRKEI